MGERALVLICTVLWLGGFGPAWASESIRLIEVIYEVDLEPLADQPLPSIDATRLPHAYVVQSVGAAVPVTLHPALDAPLPGTPPTGMWAALWFRSHLLTQADDPRALEPVGKLPYTPEFGLAGGLLPAIAVEVSVADDQGLHAGKTGEAMLIGSRSWAQVGAAERTVTRSQLRAAMAAASVTQEGAAPSEDAVDRELDRVLGGRDSLTLYARILVVDHGKAWLAEHDLLTTWHEAQRMSREGPYADALAGIEAVLDVLPRHAMAGRLFGEVVDVVEAGAVPVRIAGRLVFPGGQPTGAMQALWERHHRGYATFASASGAPVPLNRTVPIEDSRFSAGLPAGPYRLTVVVPGFETVQLDITADGDSALDVPLVAAE